MLQTDSGSGNSAGDSLLTGLLTPPPTTNKRCIRLRSVFLGIFLTINKKYSPPPGGNDSAELVEIVQMNTGSGDSAGDSLLTGLLTPPPTTNKRCIRLRSVFFLGIFITINKKNTAPAPGGNDTAELVEIVIENQSQVNSSSWEDTNDRLFKNKDLNYLRELGGAEGVATKLRSNLETGLSALNPINSSSYSSRSSLLHYLAKACNSYTNLLLLIAGVLSLTTDMLMEGPKQGWVNGVTIFAALLLLVTVPAVVDFYRTKKEEKKEMRIRSENRSNNEELLVQVIRSGQSQLVAVCDVIVGDIVDLKQGNRVPADGLFFGSSSAGGGSVIVVDEKPNSTVDPDHNPFLQSGFKVLEGNGRMIVTSVGTNTVIGKVMSGMEKDERTPLLQSRIERPNNYTEKIALCICIVIILVMFIRFLSKHHLNYDSNQLPEMKGKIFLEKLMKMFDKIILRPRGLVCILTTTLTSFVLCFQQGMSLAITNSLSHWSHKASSRCRAILQTLLACGTMGFATVICVDISGEIMTKQLEVHNLLVGEEVVGLENPPTKVVLKALQQAIIDVPRLVPKDQRGPTDDLVYSWARSKLDSTLVQSEEMRIKEKAKRSTVVQSKEMKIKEKAKAVLVRENNGDGDQSIMHLHWRGSAQVILGMCSHYYDCGGISHALDNQRFKFEKLIKDMEEDKHIYPIAFACKRTEVEEIGEDGLVLLGIVGLKFQEKTKSAIRSLSEMGVKIKLVTGDHELRQAKAIAIAIDLGICRPGSDNEALLVAEELSRLDSNARKEKMKHVTVVGKSSPEDKLLIIQILKQLGHVVVFCGGSTTGDTPALIEADVGISEETYSTEMARENSDIIIIQGLADLVPLFKYGRCFYHNIKMFIVLQLTASVSGTLITAISTMSLGDSPITAVQLAWANLIICVVGGTMMVMEPPPRKLIMAHCQLQPTRTKSVMTNVMWRSSAIKVVSQVIFLLGLEFVGQTMPVLGMNQKEIKTVIFNTYILFQVFNLFNVMELENKEMFKVAVQNNRFLALVGAALAVQVLVVQLGTSLAHYESLNGVQWALSFLFSALSWAFDRALEIIFVFFNKSPTSLVVSARSFPPFLPFLGCIFCLYFLSFCSSFSPNI